jgi:hypothetical protein
MANVYLHRIDRAWNVRRHGVLVRFADDVVVMCATRQQAEAALAQLTILLAELGLEPKAAKTRIVGLAVGGPGFDFLGFHHRLVRSDGRRSGKHVTFLARWPTNKAMQHARDRIRELSDRSQLLLPVEVIVANVNRFVRGWAAYFRYGNSTRHFDKIQGYLRMRLALVISKRHQRSRAFGRSVVFFQSPNRLGLVGLDGIVAAPRPFRAWRVTPNAGGERRRCEPGAGEPHARFDGRELETERLVRVTEDGTTRRETAGTKASGPTATMIATAPAPDPTRGRRVWPAVLGRVSKISVANPTWRWRPKWTLIWTPSRPHFT